MHNVDAPFLYNVFKTERERVFLMCKNQHRPGRYAARRKHRPGGRKLYRLLYLVNALLLVFMAVRAVGKLGEEKTPGSGFLTEAWAASTVRDTSPPVIQGVRNIAVYAGDAVNWLSGVTVWDEQDDSPGLEADDSGVDITQPGSYTVTYRAEDSAGNRAEETAAVTVLEKQEGFVDVETIYQAVDAELDGILTEDMTALQQVTTIYSWARSTRSYASHTDRSDYLQAAYEMLTTGRGDCYGYFAVTKLMFERLGIPNIDVRKVKISDSDSDHFWSLVSVDGGSTYYHFDATPRLGGGDNFCLVTDEFLDAYSAEHDNSHNRDRSLYPATPEE